MIIIVSYIIFGFFLIPHYGQNAVMNEVSQSQDSCHGREGGFKHWWKQTKADKNSKNLTCLFSLVYTRAQKRMGGETRTQLLGDVWCGERLGPERSGAPTVQNMAEKEVWSLMQKRTYCKSTVKLFNLLFVNITFQ